MADPICRWRNPFIPTVIELINILPKEELTQARAREIVIQRSPYDFYRTPYQLACQLGLYHETAGRYFPKFTFSPTENEVRRYLENWMIHYCVPNPYTNGFDNLPTFSIHAEICRRLNATEQTLNWEQLKTDIFHGEIGNSDILTNSLNRYSPIISISNGVVGLKPGKTYANLTNYMNVDVSVNRNNKEYFFDLFQVPGMQPANQVSQQLVSEISPDEISLINDVQELPTLTQTEKNQIVAARIGQGYFRRNLIRESIQCPITLINDSRLLIASHIKPWKVSNNQERINPKNGILLSPTFDRLFDKGLISFENNRSLLISSQVDEANMGRLRITRNMNIPNLIIQGREGFLQYHRNEIFIP